MLTIRMLFFGWIFLPSFEWEFNLIRLKIQSKMWFNRCGQNLTAFFGHTKNSSVEEDELSIKYGVQNVFDDIKIYYIQISL